MGALDVCPFIPIAGVSEEECVQVSKNFGARLGEEVSSSVCPLFFGQRYRLSIWLSFTAVSASLSLRGGVHSKLQVMIHYKFITNESVCASLCIYSYVSVCLCYYRKKVIFERVERVAFFRKTMPQIRAGEYEGLEEKVLHQQNSQLEIIFPFLFVYIEQYWYGPPCWPHLILSQLAFSWKRKNGLQTLVQPLLFQPGAALSPG